jgi:trigger factor
LKVQTERLPQSLVRIEVEIDQDRVEKAQEQAYKRLASRTRIPGFRPGKAPRPMVERYLGKSAILSEALDRLVPQVYGEVVEQENIEAIDRPDLEIKTLEPVVFEATIPVRPTIDLKDYTSVRVPLDVEAVSDEQVTAALDSLRERYASIQPVERGIEEGDIVTLDLHVHVDGEEPMHDEDAQFRLGDNIRQGLPGLVEGVVGLKREDEKEFSYVVPEDHDDEDSRGKTVEYKVKVGEVKAVVLPEANDDFAAEVGEGFPTLLALRSRLRQDLEETATRTAEDNRLTRTIDAILEQSEVEFPPVMVDREVDHMIEQEAGGNEAAFRQQLMRAGRTEEEYRLLLRPMAEDRIKRTLLLLEVAEQEGIDVNDDDIEAELDKLSESSGDTEQGARIRAIFDTEAGREQIRRTVRNRKVTDRLAQIAAGDAPAAAEAADKPEAEEAPAAD